MVTYLFFTLAETKMPMFCTIVSPFVFLALGAFLYKVVEWIREHLKIRPVSWIIAALLLYIAYDNLQINQIDNWHSEKQNYWRMKRNAAILNRYVTGEIPSSDQVIFNAGGSNAIMLMFCYNHTAYGYYPDYQQYQTLKDRGIKMAVWADENVPDYLKNDRSVKKIYLKQH